jgi:hypothetical protein
MCVDLLYDINTANLHTHLQVVRVLRELGALRPCIESPDSGVDGLVDLVCVLRVCMCVCVSYLTDDHMRTLSHIRTHTRTHSLSHTLPISHTHIHTRTHIPSLTHSHAHTPTHIPSLAHSLTHRRSKGAKVRSTCPSPPSPTKNTYPTTSTDTSTSPRRGARIICKTRTCV